VRAKSCIGPRDGRVEFTVLTFEGQQVGGAVYTGLQEKRPDLPRKNIYSRDKAVQWAGAAVVWVGVWAVVAGKGGMRVVRFVLSVRTLAVVTITPVIMPEKTLVLLDIFGAIFSPTLIGRYIGDLARNKKIWTASLIENSEVRLVNQHIFANSSFFMNTIHIILARVFIMILLFIVLTIGFRRRWIYKILIALMISCLILSSIDTFISFSFARGRYGVFDYILAILNPTILFYSIQYAYNIKRKSKKSKENKSFTIFLEVLFEVCNDDRISRTKSHRKLNRVVFEQAMLVSSSIFISLLRPYPRLCILVLCIIRVCFTYKITETFLPSEKTRKSFLIADSVVILFFYFGLGLWENILSTIVSNDVFDFFLCGLIMTYLFIIVAAEVIICGNNKPTDNERNQQVSLEMDNGKKRSNKTQKKTFPLNGTNAYLKRRSHRRTVRAETPIRRKDAQTRSYRSPMGIFNTKLRGAGLTQLRKEGLI